MPKISNLKSEMIPGFDNPLTSFEIFPDHDSDESPESSQNESSGGKKSWSNMQFINMTGDGYGPHATNLGEIANKIPPKPSLKKSCEKCGKRPDQEGPGYFVCASCKVSRYCGRECQTSHWKEHKKLCQSRVTHAEMERDLEVKALRDKGPFVSQAALRKWYCDNVDIVDYTVRPSTHALNTN
ncbi:hypothetical protein C8R44DRAFT_855669 [Mycena epipterygia]|nr:hypothetical protein C8R44DRAFT_855669 [Mycena epipterygia]